MARRFGASESIEQSYRTLVYKILVNDRQKRKAIGEVIISVTARTFSKWTILIPDSMTDGNRTEKSLDDTYSAHWYKTCERCNVPYGIYNFSES